MQSSARNQFRGHVSHISHGIVTDEVQIRTEHQAELVVPSHMEVQSVWA